MIRPEYDFLRLIFNSRVFNGLSHRIFESSTMYRQKQKQKKEVNSLINACRSYKHEHKIFGIVFMKMNRLNGIDRQESLIFENIKSNIVEMRYQVSHILLLDCLDYTFSILFNFTIKNSIFYFSIS